MAEALTIRFRGLSNVLTSKVAISLPFSGEQAPPGLIVKEHLAIWDTGATNSVITSKAAQELGLRPTGMTEVHTANGVAKQNTYFVNIILPMGVGIRGVKVTEVEQLLGGEANVLIGMDIIGTGDFSVTNANGVTVMSFRYPSCYELDYVAETLTSRLGRDERRKLEREQEKQKRKALKNKH